MSTTLVFMMLAGIFLVGSYHVAFAATSSKPKEIVVVGSKVKQDSGENTAAGEQITPQKKSRPRNTGLQSQSAANDDAAEEKPVKTGTR